MNVPTALEEKIVLFIALAKFPECEGSFSRSSLYGQLPDYQSHVFTLIYLVDEFTFTKVKTWGQFKISSYCLMFVVNQENQEAQGVQDSLVYPQWWKASQTESHLEFSSNINDGAPLQKQPTALTLISRSQTFSCSNLAFEFVSLCSMLSLFLYFRLSDIL